MNSKSPHLYSTSLCIDFPVERCKITEILFGSILPNLKGYWRCLNNRNHGMAHPISHHYLFTALKGSVLILFTAEFTAESCESYKCWIHSWIHSCGLWISQLNAKLNTRLWVVNSYTFTTHSRVEFVDFLSPFSLRCSLLLKDLSFNFSFIKFRYKWTRI